MKTLLALAAIVAFSLGVVPAAHANQCPSGTVVVSGDGTPAKNGFGGPVCGG